MKKSSGIYKNLNVYTVRKADETYARHSEASIIELKDGRLLMVWQRHMRTPIGAYDAAPSALAMAFSDDEGKTWKNERVVAQMIEGCINVYGPNLIRLKNGEIVLMFKRYWKMEHGQPLTATTYFIKSSDEGETWGEEKIFIDCSTTTTGANDSFVRCSDGIILLPVVKSDVLYGQSRVSVLRLDDELNILSQSNWITCVGAGLMEPSIAEMNDGKLVVVMRTHMGFVYKSESTDGGRTITEAIPTSLIAPQSCSLVVAIPNSNALMVVWNNREFDHKFQLGGKRNPLTFAISYDGLKTFSNFYNLETDEDFAFTNPSIMFTSKNLAVLNYWTTIYEENGPMSLTAGVDLKIATFNVEI